MSNKLPKSTKDRIYTDASNWSEMQYGHDDVNKDYLEGALHEAGLAQEVEQRAERYEKALKDILNTNHDNHEKVILKVKAIATEALTPKPTTDE